MILVRYMGKTKQVPVEKIKLERCLLELGINPEDVLVLKDGKLLTEDKWLKSGDEIEVIEVVSRG
ncbi:sulfur carrier protein [Thermosulfidibacter takaii ABI70S6]|uniref:Sulfur carrier protein n=1 Tax=Thermosulfidibacter takaii (strain DSM 17441 / JCM 13301 / NBRC 103674 / ABI70S6) TaxID=1298851 RepID=A0A0S3QT21_THET7|nr:MoaD/ThiS family protein [Thermosulfidibacter takaii]BAT71470.1 sulfur carrier protein [Thermosulfidibacter takaii ABI70S6]